MKYMNLNDYVMSIEPCNNLVKGLDFESKNGSLKYLEPSEGLSTKFEIRFHDGKKDIRNAKEEILRLGI